MENWKLDGGREQEGKEGEKERAERVSTEHRPQAAFSSPQRELVQTEAILYTAEKECDNPIK